MKFSFRYSTCAFIYAASLLMSATTSQAAAIASGFDTSTLAANDDGSTGLVSIGFNVNFFGNSYSSLYVNNNGNFTFNSPLSIFTPFGIGAGYVGQPIIAPFFADIDTRGAGSGLVGYGTGTYAGHTAFGATYPGVGYFGEHTDKLNTFQVILTDRSDQAAGDFDIYFNYAQIQFETGDASNGSDGLGGASAAAGFSNGTGAPGTYYQLPGSLVNGALIDGGPNQLIQGTNDGVEGQFLFEVRNGNVIIVPPISGVPLPASAPMFGAALLALAGFSYGMKRKGLAAQS